MIRTKLLAKHKAGCFAVDAVKDGRWETEFIIDSANARTYRGIDGRANGSTAFIRFICNDPSCPAVVIWREAFLLNKLSEEMTKDRFLGKLRG